MNEDVVIYICVCVFIRRVVMLKAKEEIELAN